MKIEKKSNYILISSDEKTFEEFYNSFQKEIKNIENEHIIVKISDKINSNTKEISLFLNYAEIKRENGSSFIIIEPNVDADDFPETFNIVPTLQEAKDVLEMEEIERELGF